MANMLWIFSYTYVMVSSSVVVYNSVPPELVDSESAYTFIRLLSLVLTENDIGIVGLMVLSNPCSNESPGGLDSGISTESGHLLGLSAYNRGCIRICIEAYRGWAWTRDVLGQALL